MIGGASPSAIGSRLPLAVSLGWGGGVIVTATLLYLSNALLLRYLADEVGLPAALAGTLIALSKVYDAVSDPIVGAISDRWRGARGRRRPFLLMGTLTCAVSLVLLFSIPAIESRPLLYAYVLVQLFFFATAYTIFNVPYLAMTAEMTADPHERSTLVSYRIYGSYAAMFLATGAGPMLLAYFGGGKAAYAQMTWVLAPVILCAGLLCYYVTARAPATVRDSKADVTATRDYIEILRSPPLLWLLGGKVLLLFGITSFSGSMAFLSKLILRVPDSVLGSLLALQTATAALSIPAWLWISRRMGKSRAFAVAAALFAIAMAMLLMSAGQGVSSQTWLAIAVGGTGSGGLFLMSYSLLPDVIEADFLSTGSRREGAVAAIYTLVEKLAHAAAATSLGLILGTMGYVSGAGAADQPETARQAVMLAGCVVPAAAVVLSAMAIWRVGLSLARSPAAVRLPLPDRDPPINR